MVAHDDRSILIDAFAILVKNRVLVAIHDQHVPAYQAVVAEADLLGAHDGAFCRDVELVAQLQLAAYRDLRAMADGGLAFEVHLAAYLPNRSRTLPIVMSYIAEPDLDSCNLGVFRNQHLTVQLPQVNPSRNHDGAFYGRLEREIMEVEA